MTSGALRQPWRGALAGLALFLCCAARADVSVDLHDDLVVIRADGASVREVLETMAETLEFRVHSTVPLDHEANVSTSALPLRLHLRSLLRDRSYLFVERPDHAAVLWILGDSKTMITGWTFAGGVRGAFDQAVVDLASSDPETRQEAVLILGETDAAEARPLLVRALGDADRGVREAAAAILEDLDGTTD